MDTTHSSYIPFRKSITEHVQIRNKVTYRLLRWKARETDLPDAPPLLLLHGWMDVGASFQRCVDYLSAARDIIALDWRGFGESTAPAPTDSYWFYDYYADLDAIIDHISPTRSIDLLGHSMGGNIAMIYAGACRDRIRRLINVEGFGLARTDPSQAPDRLARWLSQLKTPQSIRTFASLDDVVDHLLRRSPHMDRAFATWLAQQWAHRKDDKRWHVRADPVHKRINPTLYQYDEVCASWANIEATVLWVEGDTADREFLSSASYSRQEFDSRLQEVKALERVRLNDCGHMVHLDQPRLLAEAVEQFLGHK